MSLCLIDLDNTLTYDRTIERVAKRFDRLDAVREDWAYGHQLPDDEGGESRRLMRTFSGFDADDFMAACRDFHLREGAQEAVEGLRRLGFGIGVVSAFYQPAAESARERLGLDFAVGGEPEVIAGRLTGRLRDSPYTGGCGTLSCNGRVLEAFRGRGGLTVAVSAGYDDRCMMGAADVSIAVEPCTLDTRVSADIVVRHLGAIPAVVQKQLTRPLPV